jgi:transaldolase
MPEPTLDAVADHGVVRGDAVTPGIPGARDMLAKLAEVGIDIDDVVAVLETEGVEKFETSWAELLERVEQQLAAQAST